jgi:glyceraldehyde-3-phosphate dehydrogenase type I
MSIKVGINGFGRIGRTFFRLAYEREDIEVVAVNDLGTLESLAYLLKYDTMYRKAPFTVETKDNKLFVNGKEITFIQEREPSKIPWGTLGVDVVVESTGIFTSYDKAKAHIAGGAKRVVITGPVKDDPTAAPDAGATVLMGVNEADMPKVQVLQVRSSPFSTKHLVLKKHSSTPRMHTLHPRHSRMLRQRKISVKVALRRRTSCLRRQAQQSQ